MDTPSVLIAIATLVIAIITLCVTKESIKLSKDVMILTLSDSYDNKLAKLLAFARKSADKIEEMFNANQKNGATYTKDDFYRESGFIEHFETYHILSDSYLLQIDRPESLQTKVELISKVRKEIYDSRETFRPKEVNNSGSITQTGIPNNPKRQPNIDIIKQDDVDIIKNTLIKIRNDIIRSQK